MDGWPPPSPLGPPSPPSPPPPPTGTDDDELEALSVTQALLIACVLLVSTVTITYICAQRYPRPAEPTLQPCDDDLEVQPPATTTAPLSLCTAVRPLSPSELVAGSGRPEWPAVAARLLSRASASASAGAAGTGARSAVGSRTVRGRMGRL